MEVMSDLLLLVVDVDVVDVGMQVVQTPSPWAMVASRWTWRAEHPADGLGLGLAQLGELVGHVGDRAVLLAQLLAHDRQLAHRRRRSPRR